MKTLVNSSQLVDLYQKIEIRDLDFRFRSCNGHSLQRDLTNSCDSQIQLVLANRVDRPHQYFVFHCMNSDYRSPAAYHDWNSRPQFISDRYWDFSRSFLTTAKEITTASNVRRALEVKKAGSRHRFINVCFRPFKVYASISASGRALFARPVAPWPVLAIPSAHRCGQRRSEPSSSAAVNGLHPIWVLPEIGQGRKALRSWCAPELGERWLAVLDHNWPIFGPRTL
jgi:hypothetical protein